MVVALLIPVAVALTVLLRVHLVQSELRGAAAAAALTVARKGGGAATAHHVVAARWRGDLPRTTVRCRSSCGSPEAVVEVTLRTDVPLSPLPGSITVAYVHAHVGDRFGAGATG